MAFLNNFPVLVRSLVNTTVSARQFTLTRRQPTRPIANANRGPAAKLAKHSPARQLAKTREIANLGTGQLPVLARILIRETTVLLTRAIHTPAPLSTTALQSTVLLTTAFK